MCSQRAFPRNFVTGRFSPRLRSFFLSHAARLSKVHACTESSQVSAHGASRLTRSTLRSCSSTLSSAAARVHADWVFRIWIIVAPCATTTSRPGRARTSGPTFDWQSRSSSPEWNQCREMLAWQSRASQPQFFFYLLRRGHGQSKPVGAAPRRAGSPLHVFSFSCLFFLLSLASVFIKTVENRAGCAMALAEYKRYKPLGGIAVRRVCHSVVRFSMDVTRRVAR